MGTRIVIFDNDTLMQTTFAKNLSGKSWDVLTYKYNEIDILSLSQLAPDLIILDLRMPGKDGFAVLDELRGNPETAKIPVLVVTGDIDLNSEEQAQLSNIKVLPKTDISQDDYDKFIENVRAYLEANNGTM